MKQIIIALDGYSGTGKSSTAKEVAKALGYTYIDSGAMYRATTFYFLENEIDVNDIEQSSIESDKDLFFRQPCSP